MGWAAKNNLYWWKILQRVSSSCEFLVQIILLACRDWKSLQFLQYTYNKLSNLSLDIACESQKRMIEFYITMLIIHELGHILTLWKNDTKSLGNLFYCNKPEAGYYLQQKMFDGIVQLSGSNKDLCSWNEETRLFG